MRLLIGIILTGHGFFPKGILESVQLIAGEVKQVQSIPFEEDADKLELDIENAIQEVDTGSGVVCFTDLAGGTPFNVCSRLAAVNKNVRVIGGTNSPMLLSGLFIREMNLDEYVEKVMEEGKNNIKCFEKKERQEVEETGGI